MSSFLKLFAHVLVIGWLAVPVSARAAGEAPPAGAPQTAHGPFGIAVFVLDYRNSLVFITGSNGAGSGFLATFNKASFLVTNAHVMAEVKAAVFKTLEGDEIKVGAPAVAVGHDIFVMQAPAAARPFEIMHGVDTESSVGDAVVVLGNPEGAGVITPIPGKIVGLGVNLVEVDAPFVPGNSGSPIIHLKTGKVIGIATYLTVKNFDPATRRAVAAPAVRRFGFRLDSVKGWQPVNWAAFAQQAAEIKAIEAGTEDFVHFFNDLSSRKKVSAAAFNNPTIKSRIDWWQAEKRKRLNASTAIAVDENLMSYLKTAAQADIAAGRLRITYDYFQRELVEQQKARNEISDVLSKIIKEIESGR